MCIRDSCGTVKMCLCVMFIGVVCYHSPGGGGDPGMGEMHLLPEPLYSIPTDSTFITAIAGTANGRIFMAGKDGALYELIYQVTFLFIFFGVSRRNPQMEAWGWNGKQIAVFQFIIIIMYIYHALINALSAHVIHIN